jgi:hypothetical protein
MSSNSKLCKSTRNTLNAQVFVSRCTAVVAKQLAHNRAELANQHHGSDTGGYRKGKGSAQIQLKLKYNHLKVYQINVSFSSIDLYVSAHGRT